MKSLTTTKEVYWVLALKINPTQESRFREISAQLVESTQGEVGCLNYEWSLSEDGGTCHVYERYVDSDAVRIHRQRSGAIVKQLMALVTRLSFTLYGSPDADLKQMLADRTPQIMQPLGGFGR
jgi:quinol monooxygenase YgiN